MFKDPIEAWDSLKELLAPTPETFQQTHLPIKAMTRLAKT
ncbi:MAG: hypothetical protein ACJAX5_000086 [Patiriisocius sp.]|jgi:hypothetical protein